MHNSSTSNALKPSLARRLAAIFYDGILLSALIILIGGTWISFTENGSKIAQNGLVVIYVLLPSIFYLYFWKKSGQTLGMTTWRLKLYSLDGRSLTNSQLVNRLILALISTLILGFGYVWMLFDKDNLTFHDRFSKTALELLPKKKKTSGSG